MGKSLSEVHESVDVKGLKGWKRILAFLGPAYMVSVGYMDPGNWATDIAGGSRFGYTLIWVLLMSNIMAQLLQALSARMGVVSGRDLAQASRETYPFSINVVLYILAEIAIAACDLAEVIGMAIGLNLLFHLPLLWGVCISVLDSFLLLLLINYGIRKLEAIILSLVSIIGISFLIEMFFARPEAGEVVKGFVPSLPDNNALYIAIGIIGATVMPHNLYLHSSLVQSRKFDRTKNEIKRALKYNLIDSTVALNLAFLVNSAILILAASAFFRHGYYNVAEIQDAYKFLEPLLGYKLAPILFAVALIAAGQSSTITGTLAGQIVMEGHLNLRIQPWLRRLITRLLAVVPAIIVIVTMGEEKTGDLLILSQVILSLQLGFAVVPLIHHVSDKEKMGEFAIGIKTQIVAWLFALVIISLNVKLVVEKIYEWQAIAGDLLWMVDFVAIPVFTGIFALLFYITIRPWISKYRYRPLTPHGHIDTLEIKAPPAYRKIAITVDFSAHDSLAISQALAQGGREAEYCLVHVVETAGAILLGEEIDDLESETDQKTLNKYLRQLHEKGYIASVKLGFGNPKKAIPELLKDYDADLLVMGVHGHNTIMDLILGTTVESVRHKIDMPLLIVKK